MYRDIMVFTVWFGPYPDWLSEFLRRIEYNRFLSWVLISDQERPRGEGFWYRRTSFDAFRHEISERLKINCRKESAYALCDLRPAYGEIFSDILRGSAFWGWTDFDCVWGDWRQFITPALLDEFDVITASPWIIGGPFTVLRNTEQINRLWRQKQADVLASVYRNYDERGLGWLVDREEQLGQLRISRAAPIRNSVRDNLYGCVLRDNKLFPLDQQGQEQEEIVLYHFHEPKVWPVKGEE